MAIATFASRIFGLGRELCFAYFFGASGITDAFHVAYRIPNLLRDLLAEGAFSSAFVPSFVEKKVKSFADALHLYRSCFYALFIVTAVISSLIYFFAPMWVQLFAPDFGLDTAKLELTINLVRILSPFLIFVSLAALVMGVLNSLRIFFVPSFSPVMLNITVIATTYFGYHYFETNYGQGIYAFAVGILLGGLVQLLFQIPFLLKNNFTLGKVAKIFNPDSVMIFKKLGPGMLGFALAQMNLLVNTILATGSVVGSVSWLNYAFRLFQLPVGVFGVSLGNATLVHFSDLWKSDQKEAALNLFERSYLFSLGLMALPTLFTVQANDWLISLVYQRGEFTTTDGHMASLALACYGIALPFYGLNKLFVPLFYAIDKERTPVICSFVAIACNVVFSLLTVKQNGFHFLALASSLSMFVNCLLMGIMLTKFLGLPLNYFLKLKMFKMLISIGIAGFVGYHWRRTDFALGLEANFIENSIKLGLYGAIICLVYFFCLAVLGEKEILLKIKARFSKF